MEGREGDEAALDTTRHTARIEALRAISELEALIRDGGDPAVLGSQYVVTMGALSNNVTERVRTYRLACRWATHSDDTLDLPAAI